jgi:cell division protein FtsA
MARETILVGLEIGTSKICAVVAEAKNGALRIAALGEAPSRGVRKGEIVDLDTAITCLRDAVGEAEHKSDVEIEAVYVAISGAHIASFNNRGVVNIPEEQEEITAQDCEDVCTSARDLNLPPSNTILHSVIQHYYIDGQEGVLNPIGMAGHKLEADYHIIHGICTRIQNTVRCVREAGFEVMDVVFSPLASAQAVLTEDHKTHGALVIDIGGGTTDYLVYIDGAVKHSGVLAIGGDHINNDISMGLRIPLARAERIKVEEGSVILGNCLPGETIVLKDESGFAGKEIEREMLNTIIHMRMRETFELLKRRLEAETYLDLLGAGVFITGGTSKLKGLQNLAEEIFELPVQIAHSQPMPGPTFVLERPEFATAVGLVRYAHAMQGDQSSDGLMDKFIRLFKGFKRK